MTRSQVSTAILGFGVVLAVMAGVIAYQVGGPYGEGFRRDPRVRRIYNAQTGQLEVLIYDIDGNLRFDSWSYIEEGRVVRKERDLDEDGLIDRWEHYGPDGRLGRIGLSSSGTGTVDTLHYPGPDGSIETIEYLSVPGGQVRRTEYYERSALLREEEDIDGDGLVDRRTVYFPETPH